MTYIDDTTNQKLGKARRAFFVLKSPTAWHCCWATGNGCLRSRAKKKHWTKLSLTCIYPATHRKRLLMWLGPMIKQASAAYWTLYYFVTLLQIGNASKTQ